MRRTTWSIYPAFFALSTSPQVALAHTPGKTPDLSFILPFVCAWISLTVVMFPTFGVKSRADRVLQGFAVFLFLVHLALGILLFIKAVHKHKSTLPNDASSAQMKERVS